jgi:hypothetical protein
MSRRTISVTVFSQEQYDGQWPPRGAADFIAWFQAHLASIPEQYRHSAQVEVDSVGGYEDSHYARIEITFKRPETDDEMRHRKNTEQESERVREDAERRQLAALKKKYGA